MVNELPMLNKKNMHHYTRESLYKLQGARCNICFREDTYLEIDHIVPVCLGGGDALVNLQLLCGRCNNIKSGYTPAQLTERGENQMASRLTQIQHERSVWTEAYIISRLQSPPPLFKAADYQTYALLANPNHAFGVALTAKMLDRCISESQLIRELRALVGGCYAQNIRRWKRDGYPSPQFFRALSIALDWPIKTMCQSVDFRRYGKAMKHEPLFDLMPHILQNGWTLSTVLTLVQHATKKRDKLTEWHVQRYFSNGVLIQELLPALTKVFPDCTEAFFYNRANEILTLADLAAMDERYYADGSLPRLTGTPQRKSSLTRLRYQGFLAFIKKCLIVNGYTLASIARLPVPETKRIKKQLVYGTHSRLNFTLFAFLNLLGDFTIHDVPSAFRDYAKWNVHEIALRVNLALKTLIQRELADRGLTPIRGCKALGLPSGTLRAHIKNWGSVNIVRDRGIPKTKYKAIRAFFGWQSQAEVFPRLTAFQMRYESELHRVDTELSTELARRSSVPPYTGRH